MGSWTTIQTQTDAALTATTDKLWSSEKKKRRHTHPWRILLHLPSTVWAYLDIITVLLTTNIAHSFLVEGGAGYKWMADPWLSGGTFAGCISLAGLVFGLYEQHTMGARSRILIRSFSSLTIGIILGYACISLFFYDATSRWLGLFVAIAFSLAAIPLRLIVHAAVSKARVNILCLGEGDSIHNVANMIGNGSCSHHLLAGYLHIPDVYATSRTRSSKPTPGDDWQFERTCPRLGMIDEIDRVLEEHAIDEVVVDSDLTSHASVNAAVLKCLDRRCSITDQTTYAEKYLNEAPVDSITTQWFLMADVQSTHTYDAIKRILDIVAAIIGLILTLPLWPIISLLIRIDSSGPAFYQQVRVGLRGRLFKIVKFRTMRTDAESDGVRWALRNDSRVTRVGRFLRKSRLDELPQLLNILKGEMSLVGPRPERPEFVDKLSELIPHYKQRHLIKPGLTGWAQIRYGYGASVEDTRRKLCFDLYYLKHRSIDLDAAIVIRTIGRFLFGAR